MADTPAQKAAYAKLDEAIDALVEAYRGTDHGSDDGDVAVDAVLLVGMQAVDEDGDRVGAVSCYPRYGSQPAYITHGLVTRADAVLRDQT